MDPVVPRSYHLCLIFQQSVFYRATGKDNDPIRRTLKRIATNPMYLQTWYQSFPDEVPVVFANKNPPQHTKKVLGWLLDFNLFVVHQIRKDRSSNCSSRPKLSFEHYAEIQLLIRTILPNQESGGEILPLQDCLYGYHLFTLIQNIPPQKHIQTIRIILSNEIEKLVTFRGDN